MFRRKSYFSTSTTHRKMPSESEEELVFEESQEEKVEELFVKLDDEGVRYVVPRGYRSLPESVPGGDLDLYVDEEDFRESIKVAEKTGFEPRGNTKDGGLANLALTAARKPTKASKMLVTDPKRVYRLVRRHAGLGNGKIEEDDEEVFSGYQERKLMYEGLQLHLFNHLAYTSPLNSQKIRVDPAVEKSMLENRKMCEEWYVPDDVDEFLHLVCRGIFDYGGDFPEYYVERCDELLKEIRADEGETERLKELLSKVFFEADGLIYDLSTRGEYDEMKDELRKFSEY